MMRMSPFPLIAVRRGREDGCLLTTVHCLSNGQALRTVTCCIYTYMVTTVMVLQICTKSSSAGAALSEMGLHTDVAAAVKRVTRA